MKNLLKRGLDIHTEDGTIKVEAKIKEFDEGGWYHRGSGEYHKVNGVRPHTIVKRVLKKFLNKSFNKAFAYYCTLVPKYQQKFFLEEFENSRSYSKPDYYTDSQGVIKKYSKDNPYKGPYFYKSDDFRTEWRHKITGQPREKCELKRGQSRWAHNRIYILAKNSYGIREATDKDFEPVIVEGWIKSFNHKNDPEYVRLMAERLKKKKMQYKQWEKEKEQKQYDMLSSTEIALKKSKEEDKIKILAHGMDLVTSFRTEKQTNPDLIKERQ